MVAHKILDLTHVVSMHKLTIQEATYTSSIAQSKLNILQ